MIKPTVGRIVWYYPKPNDLTTSPGEPLAGIIAGVCSDTHLNLGVFDSNGMHYARTSVPLIQEGEDIPIEGHYATWMPYQIAKPKRDEEIRIVLESTAKTVTGPAIAGTKIKV